MRRSVWILAIGLVAALAAWFAVRAVETLAVPDRAAPGTARLQSAAVQCGPGTSRPAGEAAARPG